MSENQRSVKPQASGLGAAIAGGNPGKLAQDGRRRHARDFYKTPPEATRALIKFMNIRGDLAVWDPACGDGAMVDVFHDMGLIGIGTDIDRRINFFDCHRLPADGVKWIITNPPFAAAWRFIIHALSLCPQVAILTKAQYWSAAKRLPLFNANPPAYVLPLTWRLNFLEGQSKQDGTPYTAPTMDCMWNVWLPGQTCTRYQPLPKPRSERGNG